MIGRSDDSPAADTLLAEREKTHGAFRNTGMTAQIIKQQIRRGNSYAMMTHPQREALDMIITKIARIVEGNPHHYDHWLDIAGFARLGTETVQIKTEGDA